MPGKRTDNWLEDCLPLPRPEYAKQTEALLTDLLWRSDGSNIEHQDLLGALTALRDDSQQLDPARLVLGIKNQKDHKNERLLPTSALLEGIDTASIVAGSTVDLSRFLLESIRAPRSRKDKADACVPIHPSLVALQTLHGLVSKPGPSNLAQAIETMAWLGGAPNFGSVAEKYLLSSARAAARSEEGAIGLVEAISIAIARHTWQSIPKYKHLKVQPKKQWEPWPDVVATPPQAAQPSLLGRTPLRTPFTWFWHHWQTLTDESGWQEALPPRRFVDWAMCLLRTGLAFTYLWEAEFYIRLYERLAPGGSAARLSSMLREGVVLAVFEPSRIPASQKDVWRATKNLLAKGNVARTQIFELLDGAEVAPAGATLEEVLGTWIATLPQGDREKFFGKPLEPKDDDATKNRLEFVRYLVTPRLSDDDALDQADFYYLARSSRDSKWTWFHPGPEWLVVVAAMLCKIPHGECTLGQLLDNLGALGVRVERSVLVGLLEECGLSADSPDADNALIIRSGF